MVELVLEGTSGKAGRLDSDLFAMAVAALDDHGFGALHLADPPRVAETAFWSDLNTILLDHLGVDQAPDLLVIAFDHAHAQRDADLVRGEAGARSVEHRLDQVVEQALDRRVDARDLLRLFAQDRRVEGEDRTDHGTRVSALAGRTERSRVADAHEP